jgi:predicted nucleic acid-binding protein
MMYLLDSNTIADFLSNQSHAVTKISAYASRGEVLGLSRPVHYEVLRGLLWRDSPRKLLQFNRGIGLLFTWVSLDDTDWGQAAQFYAETRRIGRQLADTDLLLAAIAHRLKATIVSSDQDFDALPVTRIDWRTT